MDFVVLRHVHYRFDLVGPKDFRIAKSTILLLELRDYTWTWSNILSKLEQFIQILYCFKFLFTIYSIEMWGVIILYIIIDSRKKSHDHQVEAMEGGWDGISCQHSIGFDFKVHYKPCVHYSCYEGNWLMPLTWNKGLGICELFSSHASIVDNGSGHLR